MGQYFSIHIILSQLNRHCSILFRETHPISGSIHTTLSFPLKLPEINHKQNLSNAFISISIRLIPKFMSDFLFHADLGC